MVCNRQNRCDKSTAQRFWTAIVRAMGQQQRSKRTTSNSIDRFWNQICAIVPSWSLYIKSMFFELFGAYLEGDAVGSTTGCARVCHLKCSAWQKPSRTSVITHRICALWVKGTLSMDSLNLGETWLLDKKSRNLVERDTFRLWLVMACNHQNKCDKSTAQRFWTAIVRAMGQQQRSKHTTSNSIDRFWNQICPTVPSWSLYIKSMFSNFLGLTWRGTQWVLQRVVHACVTTKCRAWQNSSRN